MLVMTGANSAAALRSTPARYLALDEVDGFPPDCGGEGDPVALAIARTVTFAGRRKILLTSTPTVTGRLMGHALAQERIEFLPELFAAGITVEHPIVEAPTLVPDPETDELNLETAILHVYACRDDAHRLRCTFVVLGPCSQPTHSNRLGGHVFVWLAKHEILPRLHTGRIIARRSMEGN
jgi:Phage terminase large subunit gpA, ATPase domain